MNIHKHLTYNSLNCKYGLPRWLSGKEPACNAGDTGSIPGSGRSSGGGNGKLLQYSCPGNPIDRGTWWATVPGLQRVRHDLRTEHMYKVQMAQMSTNSRTASSTTSNAI